MRLKTIEDAEEFMEVIKECKGPVYLTDWRINKNREYNLRLNLKSSLSLYFGVSKLLEEHGDWFELHTSNREDEALLIKFMMELKEHERKKKIVKQIPNSDNGPGVVCNGKFVYIVSQNLSKHKFTLWKKVDEGYEQIATV